jgi:DNA topoisomerase-1
MKKGLAESSIGLGKCPTDGGDLVVRRSRVGKQFAACANYPKCTTTFSLPQAAKIVGTGKACEFCKTPIVKVIRMGKGVFEMCLDPNCKTKEAWKAKRDEATKAKEEEAVLKKEEEKPKRKAARSEVAPRKTAVKRRVTAKPRARKAKKEEI